MPDAYNPWGAPVFPTAADNAMQPETFVPQGVRDWTQQAAPKDYNILSQIAGSLGKALMYPGQVAQSQTPISTEDMVGPAFNLASMLTLGAGAAPQEANALNMGIKAYHGSPHDFDKFDLSKIGTGEGAQAYGHGLYFADSESVAKSYRDALAKPSFEATREGVPISNDMQRMLDDHWRDLRGSTHGADMPAALDAVEANLQRQRADALKSGDMGWYDKVQDLRNEATRIRKAPPPNTGKVYEVNINADPSHFLDWDKPLSEQPPHIQDTFERIWQQNPPDHHILGKLELSPSDEGSFAYSKLEHSFPEKSDTTNALNQAGIPGIKYLDQGSRGAGEGSSNYVVFNHDLIDIMRKYAVPGMLGAPILANALSEQKT